ncbi:MAG TPA: amidase [Acidimicrobiales bacterium]|nr:amidase [Acidimicrobiales bacterium]
MTTFITRFATSGSGLRLAVKDLIDMAGVPTTAGCRAVADRAQPADSDAACLGGARQAGVRIVGRTNLNELALGVTGENPWFGTPVNPLDGSLVPGGSSSGSAVAVATDEADVAFGSDTGGSIRIPSACCGTAGLKTTWGRVPLAGVWPLAPSLDTVGPMARTVAGLIEGMALLEPGFSAVPASAVRVGRLRPLADERIDAAVDIALSATGWEVVDLVLPEWEAATEVAGRLLVAEAWRSDGDLVSSDLSGIGASVVARLRTGADVDDGALARCHEAQRAFQRRLAQVFEGVDYVAMPTITIFAPPLGHGERLLDARCTLPVNLAGVPALALPVPSGGPLPASVQLVGPSGSEERLLGAGAVLEAAVS